MTPMLTVDGLVARHGLLPAVREVSLTVEQGDVLALVGANGAGKSTLLRTVAGAHPASGGRVVFDGEDVTALASHQRVARGLALVPEGRKLFPELTVEENLLVAGGRARRDPTRPRHGEPRPGEWTLDAVLEAFPVLLPLLRRRAATLSGGEQQATAIARAVMTNPRLLLVDEVSLGLSPQAVERVYECLHRLILQGATVVLVEQDLARALSVARHVVCLLEGRVVLRADTAEVTREQVTEAYFGLSRSGGAA
jgi:branched-chain amino acid transport system ATP-binding protein